MHLSPLPYLNRFLSYLAGFSVTNNPSFNSVSWIQSVIITPQIDELLPVFMEASIRIQNFLTPFITGVGLKTYVISEIRKENSN